MTLSKTFEKSAKEEGEGVQKIAEKIRYLRRDAFVDDPFDVQLIIDFELLIGIQKSGAPQVTVD